MLCEETRENLSAYLDKELSAEAAAAVRVHVDQCAGCRELLDDLRATVDVLDRLPRCPAPEHLAADVQREIERRMLLASPGPGEAPEVPQERTLPLHRANPIPRLLGVAATLLLVAGIGVFAYLGRPGSKTGPVAVAPKGAVDTGTEMVKAEGKPAVKFDQFNASPAARRSLDEKNRMEDALAFKGPDKAPEFAESRAILEVVRKDAATAPSANGAATSKGGPAAPAAPTDLAAAPPAPRTARPAEAPPAAMPQLQLGDASKELGVKESDPKAKSAVDRVAGGESKGEGLHEKQAVAGDSYDADAMLGLIASVAEGAAPVEKLRQAATRENLKQVENQLVIEARSREAANKDLVLLFDANGLVPLAAGRATPGDYAMKVPAAGPMAEEDEAVTPAAPAEAAHRSAGYYYPAHHNGEDIWIVVTDRDNLSRFGSQLALADGLTVSRTSSEPLRDIRKLQDQLRATEGEQAKGGRGGGPGDYRGKLAATGSLKSKVAGKPGQAGPDADKTEAPYTAHPAEPLAPPAEMPAAKKVQEVRQSEAKADEAMLRERSASLPAADQPKDTAIARAEPRRLPAPAAEEMPHAMKAKAGADGAGEGLGVNAGFPTPAPGPAPAKPGTVMEKGGRTGGAGAAMGREMKREQADKEEDGKATHAGVFFGAAPAGKAGLAKTADKSLHGPTFGIPLQPNQVILVIRVQQAK